MNSLYQKDTMLALNCMFSHWTVPASILGATKDKNGSGSERNKEKIWLDKLCGTDFKADDIQWIEEWRRFNESADETKSRKAPQKGNWIDI